MLLQPPLQMAVVRLDVAVPIGITHMDRSRRQSVMRDQRQELRVEIPLAFAADLMRGCAANRKGAACKPARSDNNDSD